MFIKLTRVSREFNESGQKKFDEFIAKKKESFFGKGEGPKDDYGNDAEFYKNLGIDPPEDLTKGKAIDHSELEIDESDYDEMNTTFLCNTDHVLYIDQHEEGRSMIAYGGKVGFVDNSNVVYVVVKESPEEIWQHINK